MAGRSPKGSKSLTNLKEAFAGESQANRRYLYFARVADIEGFPDIAGLFRDTAEAETGHAFGTKSADLLRAIPGAQVDVVERCSAVDGTWGFKTQYFELSMKVAKPLFDAVRGGGAPTVATDCPLAALQIAQGTGLEPRHPIQVLAQAYGLDDP